MTTLTLDLLLADAGPDRDAPAAPDGADDGARQTEPGSGAPASAEAPGRRTLEALIVGAWEALSAHGAPACPVCGEAMRPRYGSGAAPVGGRCGGCGSTLG
jgi:hypothetical protein